MKILLFLLIFDFGQTLIQSIPLQKRFWNFKLAFFLLFHFKLSQINSGVLFSEIDYEADRRYSRTSIQVVNGLPSNRSPRGPMPNVSVK